MDISQALNLHHPRLEAEILLAHILNLKKIQLYSQPERILSKEELDKFKTLLKRREKHEPIAYIVGYQPFMGLDFIVTPDVLIPRPETELLVETAIKLITDYGLQITSLADLGTGSGCIAISLAKKLPNIKIIATDSSKKAIEIAKQNAKKHNVENQIEFHVVAKFTLPFPVDLIISNPPYIPTADIEKLDPDVKDFEQKQALDGGKDGLDFIRELIQLSPKHLVFEFGINQGLAIRKLNPNIEIIKDYSGIERIALLHMINLS